MRYDKQQLLSFYKDQLMNDFMRFWEKAMDREYGGVFTCYSNDGKCLISTDKYVWSQGRFTFVLSKLAEEIGKGYIEGERDLYLDQAEKTCEFIFNNAILDEKDGICSYLLTREGKKKESITGKGFYTSFYVGCFVAMGFAQFAKASGKTVWLDRAISLYDRTIKDVNAGKIVAEPFPINKNFDAHAVSMIFTNVTMILADAAKTLNHPRYDEINLKSVGHVNDVFSKFYNEKSSLIFEMVPKKPGYEDTFLARNLCPGHAVECMWFCIPVILKNNLPLMDKVYKVVKSNINVSFDKENGGIFRLVDCDGGAPKGRLIGDKLEDIVIATWDSKLWWPSVETLYSSLLCYVFSGDEEFADIYDKVYEYSFRTFPNPDREVGEWLQICNREGKPEDRVVALPVKDPYHITRAFLMIIELMSES